LGLKNSFPKSSVSSIYDKYFAIVASVIIISLGILLRIIVFAGNRNLILDEVNLAFNINERNFTELLQPLSYNQFAPPLFLLISKGATIFLGTSEQVYRLFPFLCGIISVPLFYILLRKLGIALSFFYPLFFIATGLIYVRYGTEFKQYSSDILVTIGILLLALRVDPLKTQPAIFIAIWTVAGIIGILLSMPSVFILSGVAVYFLVKSWHERKKAAMAIVFLVCIVWTIQFLIYYFALLKYSIASSYLQNWHKDYFLNFFPISTDTWGRNSDTLFSLLEGVWGQWTLSFFVNILLLVTGFRYFWLQDRPVFFLFFAPMLLFLIAAGMHQYSMFPRVSLFIAPLLFATIGKGLEFYFNNNNSKWLVYSLLCCCFINMANFNVLEWMYTSPKFEWLTEKLEWAETKQVSPSDIYIHELEKPVLQYYCISYPYKKRWSKYSSSHTFYWNTNFDSLCKSINRKTVFIYSGIDKNEFDNDKYYFKKYFNAIDSFIAEPDSYAFLFLPKKQK
jgi:hypothetical protein